MAIEDDTKLAFLEGENASRVKLHAACVAAGAKLKEALDELKSHSVAPEGEPFGVVYRADIEPLAKKVLDAKHQADAMAFYARPITLEGDYAIDSTEDQEKAVLKSTRLHLVELDYPAGKLTCEDCEARKRCEFAFDGYNTNGDCLATK